MSSQVTLRDIVQLLRRRLATVLLVLVVTTGAGTALALAHPKRYESQAKVVLTPQLSNKLTFVPSQDSLQALINANAEAAQSGPAITAARAILRGPLEGTPTAFTSAGDNSITIADDAKSPARAREETTALLRVFEARMAANPFFSLTLISPASLPTAAKPPRPPLIIGSAAVLGLVLGMLFAALVDYIRRPATARA